MLDRFLVTGDCHGRFERFGYLDYPTESTAIIILGDVGVNMGTTFDKSRKTELSSFGYRVYCVRGNHDMRPEDVPGMTLSFDEDVCGYVYHEDEFPLIRYFKDGETYVIDEKKILVVGGAYSIDKHRRLSNPRRDGWTGWFSNEQLSDEEKHVILTTTRNCDYDVVLSHTCPYSAMPTDAFLIGFDDVDNSTEEWLDELSKSIKWKCWMFGHFHCDRVVGPYRIMYRDIDDFNRLWEVLTSAD